LTKNFDREYPNFGSETKLHRKNNEKFGI